MTNKKLRERWLKTTIANRMLAGSSILLTLVTTGLVVISGLQYFTSRNQLGTMQSMVAQNERLIKASSDQANASAKSATVADSEKQAVLDSADAAKKSANAASNLTEQNKELVAAARIQANNSQASAKAMEIQAAASKSQAADSKSQANSSEKMVGQNERIVKAAETQANAAQTGAIISIQRTAVFLPKLVSLNQEGRMAVDIYITSKSNLVISITGGAAEIIFTEAPKCHGDFQDA